MNKFSGIFKKKLGNYLGLPDSNIFLFWKGRVALYAILKALGVKEGDEVILPAFTCVVVANPIIYLGAKPVYIDISPDSYNVDIDKLKKAVTTKTKVILAQNTFGLAPELDEIMEFAKEKNIFVVEDCAHGFGGYYKNKKNGTIADASFFSTQWNKPFSTGIGGIAVVKDVKIALKLSEIEKNAVYPSVFERLFLSLLIFLKEKLLFPAVYWQAIKFYRFLSKHNLIIGSSQGGELEKPVKPKLFLKLLAELQCKKGIKALSTIEENIRHRQKTANLFTQILKTLKVDAPFVPDGFSHSFLKYPILVKDREKFFKKAEKTNVELGDWFVSPIHPIKKDFHFWGYDYGLFPISETLAKHIVNLPTHFGISENEVNKIEKFLTDNKNLIYKSYKDIEGM